MASLGFFQLKITLYNGASLYVSTVLVLCGHYSHWSKIKYISCVQATAAPLIDVVLYEVAYMRRLTVVKLAQMIDCKVLLIPFITLHNGWNILEKKWNGCSTSLFSNSNGYWIDCRAVSITVICLQSWMEHTCRWYTYVLCFMAFFSSSNIKFLCNYTCSYVPICTTLTYLLTAMGLCNCNHVFTEWSICVRHLEIYSEYIGNIHINRLDIDKWMRTQCDNVYTKSPHCCCENLHNDIASLLHKFTIRGHFIFALKLDSLNILKREGTLAIYVCTVYRQSNNEDSLSLINCVSMEISYLYHCRGRSRIYLLEIQWTKTDT